MTNQGSRAGLGPEKFNEFFLLYLFENVKFHSLIPFLADQQQNLKIATLLHAISLGHLVAELMPYWLTLLQLFVDPNQHPHPNLPHQLVHHAQGQRWNQCGQIGQNGRLVREHLVGNVGHQQELEHVLYPNVVADVLEMTQKQNNAQFRGHGVHGR